jgi:hypothetical protein
MISRIDQLSPDSLAMVDQDTASTPVSVSANVSGLEREPKCFNGLTKSCHAAAAQREFVKHVTRP